MIQDRSDTIAIRAGTEEEGDGFVYFLVLVTFSFLAVLLHVCTPFHTR